jgi:hypothetical protein
MLAHVHPKTPKRLERFAETHRQVGAICWAATHLELELMNSVAELARSPHVQVVAQGERGATLISWIERMLKDQVVDTNFTAELSSLIKRASRLLEDRDNVVHSVWLFTNQTTPAHITAARTRRSGTAQREWHTDDLEQLRQDIEDVQLDISIEVHNSLAKEQGNTRMPRRAKSNSAPLPESLSLLADHRANPPGT